MSRLSIQARFTLSYLCGLAAVLGLFAAGGWYTITRVVSHSSSAELDALRSSLAIYAACFAPLALLMTGALVYWMSRRDVAPIEQIRFEVDAIDFTDLTARLRVPMEHEELAHLAQTLNSMLTRIEAGFRSVERFTADASHELRAPLAFIIAAADFSLLRERTREELAVTLGKILVDGRRMSRLVDDLLALARGDASLTTGLREPIDMNELVKEAVEHMILPASAKNLEILLDLPETPLQVMGVPSDLRRLLLILLDNAIKYTERGTITMSLQLGDREVTACVKDTGIGIGPDDLRQVFDRFWRADKARSRAEGGAGLGLSLAAQIVQRNQGTLSVESALKEGTVFAVHLPSLQPLVSPRLASTASRLSTSLTTLVGTDLIACLDNEGQAHVVLDDAEYEVTAQNKDPRLLLRK